MKKNSLNTFKLKEKKDSTFKFLFTVLIESFSIGISVVASIIAGAIVGWLIDEKVFKGKYSPWITTIFIIFGAAGGIRNLIWYSRKRMK
ncbi:MAG: AtpZ/AtpI family protein, partial [Thermodesulfobacterium sp.]|nr:AtpZ/AtpI family protein [Thermodesulfobacterium sp.]